MTKKAGGLTGRLIVLNVQSNREMRFSTRSLTVSLYQIR